MVLTARGTAQNDHEPGVPAENEVEVVQDVVVVDEGGEAQAAEAAVAVEGEMMMNDFAFQPENMAFGILQRYANRERGLVRRACTDLSAEQLAKLDAINAEWINKKSALPEEKGDEGNAVLRGIGRFLGGDNNAAQMIMAPDDGSGQYKRIRTAIDAEIKSILNEEQFKIITEEKRLRDDFRQDATAAVLVSALDNHVYLSQPQRSELVESVKEWIGKKQLYWQFYFSNSSYAPEIPTRVLNQSLSKDQVEALSGLNRYNYEMDEFNLETNGMVQTVQFKDQ